jgi:hypothetical protein
MYLTDAPACLPLLGALAPHGQTFTRRDASRGGAYCLPAMRRPGLVQSFPACRMLQWPNAHDFWSATCGRRTPEMASARKPVITTTCSFRTVLRVCGVEAAGSRAERRTI